MSLEGPGYAGGFSQDFVMGYIDSKGRRDIIKLNRPMLKLGLEEVPNRGVHREIIARNLGLLFNPLTHTAHYAGTGIEGQMIKYGHEGSMFEGQATTRFWDEHLQRMIDSSRELGITAPKSEPDFAAICARLREQGVVLNDPVESEYLDVTEEQIRELQLDTVQAGIDAGTLRMDPENDMIYVRTFTYSSNVEAIRDGGRRVIDFGLGVGNNKHTKVLAVVATNVRPYLGEGLEHPTVLVHHDSEHSDGGVHLEYGKHKVSPNYATLGRGKRAALKLGAHEAVLYTTMDLHHDNYILEGCGEALFYVDKDGTLHTTPLELGVLNSRNRAHMIRIAEALGIDVDQEKETLLESWTRMEGHLMTGTWAESVIPQTILLWDDNGENIDEIVSPNTENEIIRALNNAYQDSINGRETGNPEIDAITRGQITPLEGMLKLKG